MGHEQKKWEQPGRDAVRWCASVHLLPSLPETCGQIWAGARLDALHEKGIGLA